MADLLVEEVVDWFVDLTKNDPGSADLIEDVIGRLAVEGQRSVGRWWTGFRGHATTT